VQTLASSAVRLAQDDRLLPTINELVARCQRGSGLHCAEQQVVFPVLAPTRARRPIADLERAFEDET
jgi:hypothetical protein